MNKFSGSFYFAIFSRKVVRVILPNGLVTLDFFGWDKSFEKMTQNFRTGLTKS